jgi:hypothetical protein
MNIERALAEHLPREIEECERDIARREQDLAAARLRLGTLYRIAAAAGLELGPATAEAPDDDAELERLLEMGVAA